MLQVLQPSVSASDACTLTSSNQEAEATALSAAESESVQGHLGEQQLADYEVRVVTGSSFGAGTDGQVFLSMEGCDGVVGELELAGSSSHKNTFERGQEDVFTFQVRDQACMMVGASESSDNAAVGCSSAPSSMNLKASPAS
jgi:hypothetical protein